MTLNKKEEDGRITIEVDGWLDVETTPQLHTYMEELPETKYLVFDFAKLEYISSAGVREVVAAYRRQKEADGSFSVVNVSVDVMDVFHMTGLDKKLDIRGAD